MAASGGGVVVVVAVVVVLVTGVLAGTPTAPGGRHHPGAGQARTVGASAPGADNPPPGPATFLGPDGVESRAIIAENRKPGTTAWKITDPPATGMIEGFADRNYVTDGTSFGLYVSTTAPSFHVVAYRMGYYQGKGGRQVWSSAQVPGRLQPPCPLDPATNMVSCDNWSRSLTVAVTAAWPVGDYVLKLTGSGNQQAYVPMTVWDPNSHAAYMLVNRTLTEEGWNTFGGYDYYQGQGPCILDNDVYPPCNRARVVSLDRPFAEGNGTEDFFGNEYPVVYWMEEHGLDVTYATDITLTEHPGFALQHRAWLSLDHDETWTYTELQAAKQAMAAGVNLLFFSGAAIVRHSRLQPSPLGPAREEVDYRNAAEDPESNGGDPNEVTANSWDAADNALTGEEYSGYVLPGSPPAPMVVYDASSWLFAGTGLHDGSQIPGVIGSDIDHIDPGGGLVPQDLQ
ncbi:MAG TPA: N,N-dimethylformamidase beta subunit family domain-containing protein, partial [Acidimicrobiales bacterium]|nr:N,N-dimethylformamidase beta subunit family domain-containing protein [Acidimicrobiales bacterium]